MFERRIKIQTLRDRLAAIELLQDAGEQAVAEELLKKLAQDILNG